MDDRTKGVGDERMAGIVDESAVGRAETTARRPTTAAGAPDRTRTRTDDRMPGSAGVADRGEATEERTEQIRAEIEQTRDDMSETIDAIQDRLRPRNLAANAAGSVRDAAGSAVTSVRDAASDAFDEVADSRVVQEVRANPIPATMVGVGIVGLAWLAFGGRDARYRGSSGGRRTEVFAHGENLGYYERDADARGTGRRRAVSGWSSGSSRDFGGSEGTGLSAAGDLASRTGEYAREAGWRARQTTRRAQNQLQRAMHENPLAVGAAALAVGAIIGMALPETERENELMGEARDNVVQSARETARNAANRVQEAAADAAQQVQDVAGDAVGLLSKDQ